MGHPVRRWTRESLTRGGWLRVGSRYGGRDRGRQGTCCEARLRRPELVTPAPLVIVVLYLAAFRVTRLIGWDDLPPIARLRARLTGETVYHNSTVSRDEPVYSYRRPLLAHFLGCAYCVGFWICNAVYVAWLLAPTATLYAAVPLALAALVGTHARRLDP